MLKRKIESTLEQWKNSKYGLLIDGARQVGKTYIIRNYIKNNWDNYIELNLVERKNAVETLSGAVDTNDFLLRLSALIDKPLEAGKTVIFIDEIQQFKDYDIISMMKFLVDDGRYRYVLSGSLLGVEQYGIESWPEGYMIMERMYPMDFEEFLWAIGVNDNIIEAVRTCHSRKQKVPDYIHNRLMQCIRQYMLVGGMPAAVNTFVESNDLNKVSLAHKVIEQYYKRDVTKYADENEKILIKTMYDLIPSELNSQSKRFNLKDIPELRRGENLGLTFGWFTAAGVAIPTYNVSEPRIPLELSSSRRLVKLFLADVGILTYLLMTPETKGRILSDGIDINYGAIYENLVAQILTAKGYNRLYYYSKKGVGEVDFLLEGRNGIELIEVKSGKNYSRHSALNNLLKNPQYCDHIVGAYVLNNNNYLETGNIVYEPIYMLALSGEL